MGADMKKVIFRGVGTAIITPMKENGEINYPVFKKLLDRQADGGADAVVVAGTTGENACLLYTSCGKFYENGFPKLRLSGELQCHHAV